MNDLLLYWVHRYYQKGTCLVDLGCSTGTTIDVIARMLASQKYDKAHFIGNRKKRKYIPNMR